MDAIKNALKNRKGKILNISIELGSDDQDKENEELGLAPEVDDVSEGEKASLENNEIEAVGGPGMEQGDDGMEASELETVPTSQEIAKSMVAGDESQTDYSPKTLAGKAKMKMMAMMNKK